VIPEPKKINSVLMLMGVAVVVYYPWRSKQAVDNAIDVVATDLNPASSENIIYSNTPESVKNGLFSFWGALDSVGLLPR